MNYITSIKILNRNLQTAGDYTSSKAYYVDEGYNITECYNETLDSAVFIVSNVEEADKMEIEPYDIVGLIDNDGDITRYMCVDTYTETMISVKPKIYRYEIHLFSETKQLEGIILPNLKITKVWGETRSIYFYLNRYLTEYCPQIRVTSGVGASYTYKFSWSVLSSKFTQECPEMQWNTPTLREVLNDLMMIQDCIPVIKNGSITYLDLTQVKTDLTDNEYINYVSRSKSSEDYVSEIQTNLENVTNSVSNANNIVTRSEWHTFTCPDNDATMNTENLTLKTKYPIYNIKKVRWLFPFRCENYYSSSDMTSHWYEADLCALPKEGGETGTFNIISEFKEWITKPIAYNTRPPNNFQDWANYQTWSLYYERGGYEIKNWNSKLKFKWLNQDYVLWQILTSNIVLPTAIPGGQGPFHYTYLFEIQYETLAGCLFRASKGDIPDNERVIIDNQTNSMVDSYSQGFLEYQKANRLGNEQIQLNFRYPILYNNHVVEIGDIYEDSVIYQVQYQYFKNHMEANAIATKDYVLREYFTGVKSKIRSWRIASGDEALTRHDLEKFYCEFSYVNTTEVGVLNNIGSTNIAYYLASSLYEYEAQPIRFGYIRTRYVKQQPQHPLEFYYPGYNKYFEIDTVSRVVGNSLVFTLGFDDNYWAGKSYHTEEDPEQGESGDKVITYDNMTTVSGQIAISSSVLLDNQGVPTYQHRYTNDDGEYSNGYVVFADGIKVIPDDNYADVHGGDKFGEDGTDAPRFYEQSKQFMYYLYQRPVTYEKNIASADYSTPYDYGRIKMSFEHKKDSQEIPKLSVQLEFCTASNDIAIGKEWLTRQRAISASDNNVTFYKLFFYNSSQYNFRKPNVLPSTGLVESGFAVANCYSLTNTNTGIYLIYNHNSYQTANEARQAAITLKNNRAVYLCEASGSPAKVLLSFNNIPDGNCFGLQMVDNGPYFAAYLIHLNVLKSRSKNVYTTNNHYLISRKM